MENVAPPAVVEPGKVPPQQPADEAADLGWFPLWSKWVDSKGKLWIIVGHSAYATLFNRHTATNVHCLDVAKEYEQVFHIMDLRLMLKQGRLTRLTGVIIPEAITQ